MEPHTNKVLILCPKGVFVCWELHPQWPHDGASILLSIVEQCIPVWQQPVTNPDGLTYRRLVLLRQHPRLTATGVQMSMGTEEWLVSCCLQCERYNAFRKA